MAELRFPDGFLWGAATAAHQVEGDNAASDWWDWERRPGTPVREPSGRACDHYARYPQDIALLADLGFNTYRYSIEWARIEPVEGQIDASALDHYRRMTETVRAAGLTPMVTLNHFTLPRWLAARGGWMAKDAPAAFARYSRLVVRHLADSVDWYCTINEPGNVAIGGYLALFGWPPGTPDLGSWERAARGLVEGHRRAVDAVRTARPEARVGMTHAMQEWAPNDAGRAFAEHLRWMFEDVYLEASRDDDFIGVQTYTRVPVEPAAAIGLLAGLLVRIEPLRHLVLPGLLRRSWSETESAAAARADGVRRTQMGYEFRPEAIAATLRRAARLLPGKDLVITEHGVATADDGERVEFVQRGLAAIHDVIAEGVPVRGYIHWSLLDNFEWAYGYAATFGLIGIDRSTQERTVRPSARFLGEVARTGCLSFGPRRS